MNEKLRKELESTIVSCAIKAQGAPDSVSALQYTQAALNAANAMACLNNIVAKPPLSNG